METSSLNNVLKLKHVFGVNQKKNCINLLNGSKVFYVCGHNVIKLDTKRNIQSFIPGDENYEKITALALSQNQENLAIAEAGSSPIIYFYDPKSLKKNKFLQLYENNEEIKEYIDLRFQRNDDNVLFSIGRGKKCYLLVWNVLGRNVTTKFYLFDDCIYNSFDFSFKDKNIFCVVGKNVNRLYRIDKKKIDVIAKSMCPNQEYENADFSCVRFLKKNDFVIFKNNLEILLCSQHGVFLKSFKMDKEFDFLANCQTGFMIFFDNFEFANYDTDSSNQLVHLKTYKIDQNQKSSYTSLCYNEKKEIAFFITKNSCLYSFRKNTEVESKNFEKVSEEYHSGPILDLSVAVKKPHIATCSTDKKIKIWNYFDFSLVNDILLNEDPLGLEFHPSGLHLVVYFLEKISIINLYPQYFNNKKKGFKDINFKNISKVKFSEGGEKLAIANSKIIDIYKFYTCEKMHHLVLKGHSGKIVCLKFCKNDSILYSCGADGIVYQWNLKNGQRIEIITKGSHINDLTYNSELDTLFIATDNKHSLLKYNEKNKNRLDCKFILSQVCVSANNQMLFGGADGKTPKTSGIIRYFKNFVNLDFGENYSAHDERGVSKIQTTFNNSYLISAGHDGGICVFVINSFQNDYQTENDFYFSNDVLVTKNEIEELNNKKDSLTNNYSDNTFQNNNLMTLNNLDDEIKLLNENIDAKEQKKREIIEKYETMYINKNIKLEEEFNALLQLHEEEIHELEHIYNKDIGREANKLEENLKKFDEDEKRNENELLLIKKSLEKTVKNLEEQYSHELKELENSLKNALEEKEHITNINDIKLNVIKEECTFEENKIVDTYSKTVLNKKEECLKIKNQAIALKKKKLKYELEIESLMEFYNENKKKLEALNFKLNEMKFILNKKNEILQKKNKIINEKEKKIYLLKKETQELEKYEFVLDYTITDLKQEIAPKEEEITHLKYLISKEDEKLKNFNNVNTNLENYINNLENNTTKMNKKIKNSKEKLRKININIDNLKNFIFNAVQDILDYDKVKEKLKKFPLKKIQEETNDNQIDFEYENQIAHLDNTVLKFRLNIKKDSELHLKDNREYVAQNIKLIKEILRLRKELKCLKEAEKPETIILRKNKRLRNILSKKDRLLDYDEKVELVNLQEKEIAQLKNTLFSMKQSNLE